MPQLPWLDESASPNVLPCGDRALQDPNGLLAAGGSLRPEWLLHAYRNGVFPWYDDNQPILWWSPDPRAVLRPDELKISRSLRRRIASRVFQVRSDTAFSSVVSACAAPRDYEGGTWITNEMHAAYCRLHELGAAHSFESWRDERLVGGLYGVAIGQVFFGESMFSLETDASKVAFAAAVAYLRARNFELIDCQLPSEHLRSLGAIEMRRAAFLHEISQLCANEAGDLRIWTKDFDHFLRD